MGIASQKCAGRVPFTQCLPLSDPSVLLSRRSLGCWKEYSAFGEDHHHHQDHHSLWIRIRLLGWQEKMVLYRVCWTFSHDLEFRRLPPC